MRTRDDIEADLRRDNPTSEIDGTVYSTGQPPYEDLIARWTDHEWEREKREAATIARAEARAELAAMWLDPEVVPIEISGPYGAEFRLASAYLDEGRDDLAAQVLRFAEPRSGYDLTLRVRFLSLRDRFAAAIAALPKLTD